MKSLFHKASACLLACSMAGVMGLSWVGGAQATQIACPSGLAGALGGNDGCEYVDPFTGSDNDSASVINSNLFFGFNNWSLNGSVGGLLEITNGVPSTFTISGLATDLQALVIAKDGSKATLVGYLYNPDANGTYSLTDPYSFNPPFTQGSLSHLSLYTRGGTPSVPEPASLLLLGAGLAAIGIWSWRRKLTNI